MIDVGKVLATQDIQRASTDGDRLALNELLTPHGLAINEVVDGVSCTTFKIKLKPGSKLTAIKKLNFAIALDSEGVTVKQEGAWLIVQKPTPGRTVGMGNLLEGFQSKQGHAVMIGIDERKNPLYYSLEEAPHMLVCGSTGSGKSVFLHQLICSLLLAMGSAFSLILVDMKGTELACYERMKNAICFSSVSKAVNALAWACIQMERNYKEIAAAGAKDIDGYNALMARAGMPPMTRTVIVIDEFADLMLVGRSAIEPLVIRLAQKARAAGIHLVIATQYPKAEVVTGLIKANIPTRVCFRLTSAVQSRVAIDRNGAEKLNGKGDMLFLPNGAMEPVRAQGCLVSNDEIAGVISCVKADYDRLAASNAA